MYPAVFNTLEVAEICWLNAHTIRRWVQKCIIVPAERGRKGKGNSHLYSERQLIALGFISVLSQSPMSFTRADAKQYMEHFGAMSDQALEAWIAGEAQDDYQGEAMWSWATQINSVCNPNHQDNEPPCDCPLHRALRKLLHGVSDWVIEAIKTRRAGKPLIERCRMTPPAIVPVK